VIRDGLDFNYADVSADGRWVAAANYTAGAVAVYQTQQPTNRFALAPQLHASGPAFSPDGRWLAAGNWKGTGVKVWELASRKVIFETPAPSPAVVTFNPDGHWLLVGGANYEFWETSSWKRKRIIARTGPETSPAPMAFSRDGSMLAIAPRQNAIQLLDAATGVLLANLESPQAANISCLRFSPDNGKLFALQWDQQVQVWDLRRTREELRRLNLDWTAPPL
jgi:WD40 repeat protein